MTAALARRDDMPAPAPRKRTRSRKYSSAPLAVVPPVEQLGPAMLGCTEKQRRFVLELRDGPVGYGSEVRAARAAGYGGPASTDNAMKVEAHRVLHNPNVQAALREVGARIVRAEAFQSIRNVVEIARDLKHRDCLKANLAIMDRGGFAVETTHNIKVEHEHTHRHSLTADQVTARILELAARAGVDVAKLPPTIDAVAEELPA